MPATIVRGYTFGATELVTNSKLHSLVDSATISGIVDTELAQITTASKVSGAALVTLGSIPSGAGVVPSVNLNTSAIVLLSATTVALNANADTTIYTVPAGKRCILSHAILVAGADAGTSDISIGKDTAETDFVGVTNLDNLNAQYDAMLLAPVPSATPATLKSYAAGVVIQAQVANQAGGATNTLFLFWVLY